MITTTCIGKNNLRIVQSTFYQIGILASFAITGFAQSVTFNYTGSSQTWVVPPCVTSINITAAGADGGGAAGGNGAVVTATLTVTPGQTLQINVGGSGNCPGGGFNGGGNGQNANNAANGACGGGGASDIRVSPYNLANRLVVAAGGGGMGGGTTDAVGATAGCASGVAGTSPFGQGGGGGSQAAGGNAGPPWISSGNYGTSGSLGVGGNGGSDPCYNLAPGGGGGGGYYGGGGGGSDCYSGAPYGGGSGGGGSSLIPAGGSCTVGSNNGPGYVTITYTIGVGSATATNDGPYCVGGTIQLSASGGTDYSWTGPNGFTSILQNPTISGISNLEAGSYDVTVSSAGCSASAATVVVINSAPVVNAGLDQPVCEGTSVTLSGSGATTYSWDNGVSNGISFIPAVGSVTYTVIGTASGCTNTDQVVVTVNALPTPNAGSYSPVCIDASNVALVGTPSGGTFSGTGVSGNSFSPASGTQTITYTYTDANSCTNTANATITVNNLPVVSAGTYSPVCVDAADVTLVGSPVGGTFSGTGVSGNNFDPSNGTQTITYTYTDGNSCTNSGNTSITVNTLPIVNAGTYSSVCVDAPDVVLAGTPAGGTFSGTGVSGNNFDPSAGTQTLTYTYTDGNSCTNSANTTITVNNPSAISAGTYSPICVDAGLVNLSGTPSGGTFSGTGVSGNTFDPASGTQTLTYTYVDGNGCGGSADATITVNSLPVVSAGVYSPLCQNDAAINLVGNPVGGSFSGPGVSSSTFNPSNGTQTITYSYTDANSCTNTATTSITVNAQPVVDAGTYSPVCVDAPDVALAGSPAGGIFSGTGVTGNNFNPSVNTQLITYSYTDANSCSNSASISIVVNPLPTIDAGADQTMCLGSSITLNGSGGTTYTWSDGVTNGVSFTPSLGSTVFYVTGTDANGCTNIDSATVTVLTVPVAEVSADIYSGYSPLTVNFANSSTFASSYVWDFGNGPTVSVNDLSDMSTSYNGVGTYQVVLLASNGICSDTDTLTIIVDPFSDPIIHVPNVFTPNSDGANDFFYIDHQYVAAIHIIVLNRWGNLVFETEDLDAKWDGADMSEGVYFYKYIVTGINETVLEGHGNVTLLR